MENIKKFVYLIIAMVLLTACSREESSSSVVTAKKLESETDINSYLDDEFLNDMAQSITERMVDSDKSDWKKLVDKEFAYLDKYRQSKSTDFKNEELADLSKKYLSGLDLQKQAFKQEIQSEFDVKWYQGYIKRLEVLKELNEKYNFLSDNKDFLATYILSYKDEINNCKGYEIIEKYFDDNPLNLECIYDDQGLPILSCDCYNGTDYKFDNVFNIDFYNKDKVKIDTKQVITENIEPKSSFRILLYVDNVDEIDNMNWNNYYINVQYKGK